jgi:hypothetical protein
MKKLFALPGQTMIRVAGKIMIACAGIAIFSVLYFNTDLGFWLDEIFYDAGGFFEAAIMILVFSEEMGVVYALMLLALGIFGVVYADKPEKAPTFIVLGVVSTSLQAVVRLLVITTTSYYGGISTLIFSIFLGIPISCALPILYIIGGNKLKKTASETHSELLRPSKPPGQTMLRIVSSFMIASGGGCGIFFGLDTLYKAMYSSEMYPRRYDLMFWNVIYGLGDSVDNITGSLLWLPYYSNTEWFIAAALTLAVGICGVILLRRPAKAAHIITLGFAVLLFRLGTRVYLAVDIWSTIRDYFDRIEISLFHIVSRLFWGTVAYTTLPSLYIIGGFKLKKAAAVVVDNIENQNP